MIEPPIQHIRFMYFDDVYADIWFSLAKNYIKVQTYSDDWLHLPFGRKPDDKVTINDFNRMLEERCFEPSRKDCLERIKAFGIPTYDPLAIVHLTHGYMWGEGEWIRFDNDPPDISYKMLHDIWE